MARLPAPALLAATLAAAVPSPQEPFRYAAKQFDAGDHVASLAVADLDADGDADVAVGDRDGSRIRVQFSDGAGGFSGSVDLPTGFEPTQILIGEVDGGPRLDVIAIGKSWAEIHVFLGAGGGSFVPLPPIPMPTGQAFARAGDVDLDGDLDLVCQSQAGLQTTVLLGDGSGGFAPQAPFVLPTLNDFALVELTGDGVLDLAILRTQLGDALTLYAGDGSGGFALGASHAFASEKLALLADDLDGNGTIDLVAASTETDDVEVFLMPGTGTIPTPTTWPVGDLFPPLALGDLDGDGVCDLVATIPIESGLAVLLGDGLGGFGPPALFEGPFTPVGIAIAELTGDGAADVVVAANVISLSGTLLTGDGAGGLVDAERLGGFAQPLGIAARDLEGDGDLDLFVADGGTQSVELRIGDGFGGLAPGPSIPLGPFPTSPLGRFFFVEDLDGDGAHDLLVLDQPGGPPWSAHVALGDGLGGFGPQITSALPFGSPGATLGELDGDGERDLAVLTTSIEVLLGSAGTFGPPIAVPFPAPGEPVWLEATDLDADGKGDLLYFSRGVFDARVSVLLGDGMAGFTAGASVPIPFPPSIERVLVADFDEDGALDVYFSGIATRLLLGDGLGGLAAPVEVPGPESNGDLVVADVDRDGHLDVVSASIEVLFGDGQGGFPRSDFYAGPLGARGLAVGDLDGDLWPEIAVASTFPTGVMLFSSLTPCPGIDTAGSGCPGTGGVVPRYGASGCPTPGAAVRLEVSDGLAGAPVALLAGDGFGVSPLPNGCALELTGLHPFTVSVVLDGAGDGSLVVPFGPSVPISASFTTQAFVVDPGAPGFFSATNGLELRVQ